MWHMGCWKIIFLYKQVGPTSASGRAYLRGFRPLPAKGRKKDRYLELLTVLTLQLCKHQANRSFLEAWLQQLYLHCGWTLWQIASPQRLLYLFGCSVFVSKSFFVCFLSFIFVKWQLSIVCVRTAFTWIADEGSMKSLLQRSWTF